MTPTAYGTVPSARRCVSSWTGRRWTRVAAPTPCGPTSRTLRCSWLTAPASTSGRWSRWTGCCCVPTSRTWPVERHAVSYLSAATRHRRLVALRSLLKFCAREEWTPGDLGVTIDLPRLPRRLPKPLDPGELDRMTTAPFAGDEMSAAGLRDRALVAFLLSTGCRISEALALDRLDWNTGSVIVRGKGDVERSVVITDRARTEVDAYLYARDDDGPALFVSYSPGRAGRRLSVRGAEAVCHRLGLLNHVTKLHPHRFRHTAGTIVQDELGDPRVTADYLGHHGLGSVAGYTEVSSNRRAQAGDALTRRGM